MKINSKRELKRWLSDSAREGGLTDQQVIDLVDSLWRDQVTDTNHVETGNATVDDTTVSVTYAREFAGTTYYLSIQAFRILAIAGAGNVRQDIPYHSLSQTTSGFSLTLAEYEAGDVVRFYAVE